jgi:eukaryotic-like serine/threonine-protein kinase
MGTEDPELPSHATGESLEAARLWNPGDGTSRSPVVAHGVPGGAGASAHATALAARMHGVFEPGSHFGVYVVGACIGEGGMARIYRAEHAGLRRQVALKVLIHGFSRDLEGRERFLREARIAAAIKHPNVVNIFDVGVHDDIPYLVMELLEGTDLEAMIAAKGPLDESLILDIMVPVVAGLTAVHDAGIVHRDLKPGNIFLSKGRYEDLEPKLLDFGISKAPDPDQRRITNHGHLMGTPFYMSPEGVRCGELTPLSDQYSLAVVMYECATGRAPYLGANLHDLVHMISTGSYRPPDELNPRVSKRLAGIITRAMSLEPERRFPDLRAMGRELLSLAGHRTRITWGLSFGPPRSEVQPEGPGPDGAPSAAAEPTPEQRPRALAVRLVPFGLAALGALLAFAVVGIWHATAPLKPQAIASGSPAPSSPTLTTLSIGLPPAAAPEGEPAPAAPSTVAPHPVTPEPAALTGPLPRSPGPATSIRKQRHGSRTAPTAEARGDRSVPEPGPDWAIPFPTPAAPQARVRDAPPLQNSNGAPIFD